MSYSIGISAYFHESSVSVFHLGKLIGFAREEYFSRVKGDNSFPRLALEFYKDNLRLSDSDIDFVCFYEKPLRSFFTTLKGALPFKEDAKELVYNNIGSIKRSGLFFYSDILNHFKITRKQVLYCPHHVSHVLSCLPFMSTSARHTAIVIDGVGDSECSSVYLVDDNDIKLVDQIGYPHSLGLMYSAVTDFLGFNINDGEYKVMALAAYGRATFEEEFDELVGNGPRKLNLSAFNFYRSIKSSFSDSFIESFGDPIDKLSPYPKIRSAEFQRAADIAFAAQRYLEKSVVKIFEDAYRMTGESNFSFSGGVALNSKLVSVLIENSLVESIFVPPCPGDSGAAVGAGVFASMCAGYSGGGSVSPFLGPDVREINQVDLKDHFLELHDGTKSVWSTTAELVNEGEIIALVDGGAEVGPRSLGHRSLLCDPRNEEAVTALSERLKGREEFRPLAPACLESEVEEWFVTNIKAVDVYKWMGTVVTPTSKCKKILPAINHVDNTARLQSVEPGNQALFSLLTEFHSLTACPVLVNTSFNSGGDPIVLDEQDAITTALRMGLKYMVLSKKLYRVIQ